MSGPRTPADAFRTVSGAYGYNFAGVSGGGSMSPLADGADLGLGGPPRTDGSLRITRESEIARPADMIAFGDAGDAPPGWNVSVYGPYLGDTVLSDSIYDFALWPAKASDSNDIQQRRAHYRARHSGRFNITFCDGHVEYGKSESFFSVRGHPFIAARWNKDNQPHMEQLVSGGY